MRLRLWLLLFICLTSCSPERIEDAILTPQERSLAREAIRDVARGDVASFEKKLAATMRGQAAIAVKQMQRELPSPPLKLTFSDAHRTVVGDERTARAVYIVEGRGRWALVDVVMHTNDGSPSLAGFHLGRFPGDPNKLTAFNLSDARPIGWAVLVAMLGAIAATIAALMRIWRSGMFGRRWLWTIGTLIGVTTFKLNWTTGEWAFQPLSIQFFSVSALKQATYMPWVLGVSLPVVAVIALLRRRMPQQAVVNPTTGA